MKNKKAQLGKIIVAPYSILLVAVIMVGFVFLSAVISLKSPELAAPKITTANNDLLLKTLEIQFPAQNKNQMLLLDALVKADIAEKRLNEINSLMQIASGNELGSLIEERKSLQQYPEIIKQATKEMLLKETLQNKESCLLIFKGQGKALQETINLEPLGKDLFYKIRNNQITDGNAFEFEQYEQKSYLAQISVSSQNLKIKYYYGECKNVYE